MLNSLARTITSFFIAKNYLKKEMFDWYVFVLEKKLVAFLGLSWLIFLGTILSDISSTTVFIAGFYLLRSRAGGYHANSFRSCLILSTFTVVANFYILTPVILRFSPVAPIILSSVCFLVLQILGTVAHPSTQLTKSEMTWQCIFMRLIVTAQFTAIIVLIAFNISIVFAVNLSSGMGFVAVSSVIGKIKMRRKSHGKQGIIAGIKSY